MEDLAKTYQNIYSNSQNYICRVNPHITFDRLLPEVVAPYDKIRSRKNLWDEIRPEREEMLPVLITAYEHGFPHLANDIDFWHLNLWSAEWFLSFHNKDYCSHKIIDLMVSKRADYGDRPFRISGTIGVMARSADKICRYNNLLNKKTTNFESCIDSLVDLFNYSLVGIELINKKCVG